MADPNQIIKVPLNTSQFLNFTTISLSSSPNISATPSKTAQILEAPCPCKCSGKKTKKVKAISWKATDAQSIHETPETSSSVSKCLSKSKEIPDSNQIFEDLDWTKYLSSRRKSNVSIGNSQHHSSAPETENEEESPSTTALAEFRIAEPEFLKQFVEVNDQIPDHELEDQMSDLELEDQISDHELEDQAEPKHEEGPVFHHTNPFCFDGEGTFSLPLPLYREKLMEPDEMADTYFHFQDGGECFNPFLERHVASPINESIHALFEVSQDRLENPDLEPEPVPLPVASFESSWDGGHLNPPDGLSTYFQTRPSVALEVNKVYRNRRTESSQSATGTPSTPKFLSEVRASLSNISLIPAVSSVPSIPTSGSRASSFHSQSASDDRVADTEEVDGYCVRRHKKKFRKFKRCGQIASTSLDSKIIEILQTYNNAVVPVPLEQPNSLPPRRHKRKTKAPVSLEQTQSVPVQTQTLDLRFYEPVPKARNSTEKVNRKKSMNPDNNSCRPMPRGPLNAVPKQKMQLCRNIVKENIILAKYAAHISRGSSSTNQIALNRTLSLVDRAKPLFGAVQKRSSVPKIVPEIKK